MDLLQKPQLITHAHKSLNFTLYDTRWIPHSARFVVLGSHPRGTGALQIYELTRGDANILKEVMCFTDSCKSLVVIFYSRLKNGRHSNAAHLARELFKNVI